MAAPSALAYDPRMTDRDRDTQQKAAQRELEKLRQESDSLGGLFARWFIPRRIDTSDPIEVWGTRIGRGLSVVALIAICVYLVWIYLR